MLWILLAVWLLGLACIPHLLLLNKRPTATVSWLWLIVLVPLVGAVVYLAIGTERVKERRMKRRHGFRGRKRWTSSRAETHAHASRQVREQALSTYDQAFLQGLGAISELPLATVSSIEILRKGQPFYEALRKDIQQATEGILIQTYIWRDDEVGKEFLDLLIAACHRRVAVRLLIDELGSLYLRADYFQPLLDAGGKFSWVHTLSPLKSRYSFNLRNHRKLQIIDGRIAYVGGMNFGREYLGRDPKDGDWTDTQVRVEGKAVSVLEQLFAEDWFFATGKDNLPQIAPPEEPGKFLAQVLRGGPDEEDHPMLRINMALAAHAQKRLWIATGYFVPGEAMQTALQVAAARHVDVRLLVSEKSEHPLLVKAGRSYYDALLRHGIRIFEYHRGIEHSKYTIVDEDWSVVGSSNFDERSMRLNFELSLLMQHKKTNSHLAQIFEQTMTECQEIDRQTFAQRPLSEKLIDSAMRLFSPLL